MLNSNDEMKSRNIIFVLLTAALLGSSCTERIKIDLDESSVILVVDGSITTDTMAHAVILTRTTNYFYNQEPPHVTGAQVQISDGENIYVLAENSPGIYSTEPTVYGVPGATYTLDIKLASPVGGFSEYTSVSKLYPVSQLDSVSLTFHPDWSDGGMWEVKCSVQDPPTTDFYRFVIARNWVSLTDTLDEWFVTDDRFFNGNYAYDAPVAYLEQGKNDEGLSTGDTVIVEINNIGSDYANFIWQAQAELMGSNPLFSGPPANVKGNISNGAAGFFAAYSASRAYTIVEDNPFK
jgi:hypothetical protein